MLRYRNQYTGYVVELSAERLACGKIAFRVRVRAGDGDWQEIEIVEDPTTFDGSLRRLAAAALSASDLVEFEREDG